jgi:uncharacterized membrane protein YqjE
MGVWTDRTKQTDRTDLERTDQADPHRAHPDHTHPDRTHPDRARPDPGGPNRLDQADQIDQAERLDGAYPPGRSWRAGRAERAEPSVPDLVLRASHQVAELIRQELRLAVAEMKDKGRHAGFGAGLVGGAALVAVFGAGSVLIGVVAALALVLPVWAAALIVGAVLLIVAGLMALTGRHQVGKAVPPVPDQTLDSAKKDISEVTERAHR